MKTILTGMLLLLLDFAGATGERDALTSAYLSEKPSSPRITSVSVAGEKIRIDYLGGDGLKLAEVPLSHSPASPIESGALHELPDRSGTVALPRTGPGGKDRLLSRWQLVRETGEGVQGVSTSRYADQFPAAHPDLPEFVIRNKKGLGGWNGEMEPKSDLAELGIAAVTVNVLLDSLVAPEGGEGTESFPWQGKTYHARREALDHYDASMKEAAKSGCHVSAILLIGNPARSDHPITRRLGHPDATRDGHYAMPAMDDPDAVDLYGAIIHLLAERYSRPDGKFGRIHSYIIHNEVDAGWHWTNCGRQPLPVFMDLYHRSMRLVDLIARSEDPNARVFISLTHHWSEAGAPEFYPGREVLRELLKWNRAEGDFPWGVAYHPYPADLRNPRTWEDRVGDDFETSKITPRNLAVLDRWMQQDIMRDREGRVRPVYLSENGCNSPDYSEASLRDQAAGTAFAWEQFRDLESIKVWHNHRWIDHPDEGGLLLGLRKLYQDPDDPAGPKPVWHLYRDLGTEREAAALEGYRPIYQSR